ncbi:MAG: LysM peptidoglycan-binding domain-containing protein [Myxococcota bacterium]
MKSLSLRALIVGFLFPLTVSLAVAQDDEQGEGGTLWDRVDAAEGSNSPQSNNGKGAPVSSGSSNGKTPPGRDLPPPQNLPTEPPPLPEAAVVIPPINPALQTDEQTSSGEEDGSDERVDAPRGPTTEELLLRIDRTRFNIPIVFTPEVIQWVQWFTRGGRGTMGRWMGRSTRYKDMMQAELIKAKLPTDIFYLAMIESGFYVHARSHAEAVGPWQFIESTALHYELRVDEWIDERKDPLKSTQAAARYLNKLKNDFGNWYMAFASYNAGEGLVFSAIRNYGTIDFFGLARIGALPDETKDYVPKLLAAAIVAKNPDVFGFQNVRYLPKLNFEPVEVDAEMTISKLARSAEMTEDEFRALNPHLLGDRLPSLPVRQEIYLPTGMKRAFYAALKGMPTSRSSDGRRIAVVAEEAPDRTNHTRAFGHTVADGETLDVIAARYTVSVDELRSWNRIAAEDGVTAGQILKTEAPAAARWVSHQVRRGETLTTIAQKYGCSVENLRSWNGIAPDVSRPDPDTVLWLETHL